MIRLVIEGELASKANQRRLVVIKGRAASIKSSKAIDWARAARLQIPLEARQRLEGPVALFAHIYYATERPDLDESLLLDVLQDLHEGTGDKRQLVRGGVYRNDRQVRLKIIRHGIDRARPRCEIVVMPLDQVPELPWPSAN